MFFFNMHFMERHLSGGYYNINAPFCEICFAFELNVKIKVDGKQP